MSKASYTSIRSHPNAVADNFDESTVTSHDLNIAGFQIYNLKNLVDDLALISLVTCLGLD